MKEDRVAREYAQALFEAAEERGQVEKVSEELGAVLDIILGEEFRGFFLAQKIGAEDKKRAFNKAFKDLNRLTRNFFWLVFDNHREELLSVMKAEFDRKVDEYKRRVVATVTTPVELPDELAGMIKLKLEGVLGKEVILKPEVDEKLLGGYVIAVGDRIIDASLKSRLEDVRERLTGSHLR